MTREMPLQLKKSQSQATRIEFQSDITVLMDCQRGPAWKHLAIAVSAKTQGLIVTHMRH